MNVRRRPAFRATQQPSRRRQRLQRTARAIEILAALTAVVGGAVGLLYWLWPSSDTEPATAVSAACTQNLLVQANPEGLFRSPDQPTVVSYADAVAELERRGYASGDGSLAELGSEVRRSVEIVLAEQPIDTLGMGRFQWSDALDSFTRRCAELGFVVPPRAELEVSIERACASFADYTIRMAEHLVNATLAARSGDGEIWSASVSLSAWDWLGQVDLDSDGNVLESAHLARLADLSHAIDAIPSPPGIHMRRSAEALLLGDRNRYLEEARVAFDICSREGAHRRVADAEINARPSDVKLLLAVANQYEIEDLRLPTACTFNGKFIYSLATATRPGVLNGEAFHLPGPDGEPLLCTEEAIPTTMSWRPWDAGEGTTVAEVEPPGTEP